MKFKIDNAVASHFNRTEFWVLIHIFNLGIEFSEWKYEQLFKTLAMRMYYRPPEL